jgi:hypothetical protein
MVAGPPVFVVGIPRSGTTLLSAMLAAHPRLDCGPESRILARLRHLEPGVRARLIDPSDWPDRAVAFVTGHATFEDDGTAEDETAVAAEDETAAAAETGPSSTPPTADAASLYGLSRQAIRAWLADRPPSLAALLESLTVQHAQRAGKPRWVEKTPRHLLTLDTIRELWPAALVVRIVRDPRDVAVSLAGMPFGDRSQVGNLVRIDFDDRRSRGFFEHDRLSSTVRYEDLVEDPERVLRGICAFIGEDFSPGMQDPNASAATVTAGDEWWKADVAGPIHRARVGRWHAEMPEPVARFAGLHLGRYLREHGYDGALAGAGRVAAVPIGDAVTARDEELLLALSTRSLVVARPSPRRFRDLRGQRRLLFVGVRGQLDPLRQAGVLERCSGVVGLAALLSARRLRGRPVLWLDRPTLRDRRPRDPGEMAVASLLRLLARRVRDDDVADRLAG